MEEGNFVSLDNENGFGYSVDNIHPATPELTSAEHEDMDVSLNWQYELEEDFAYHRITSLNSTDNTISNEHSFTLDGHDEHWVNSVDYNGNYSDNTESIMSMALGQGANLRSFNVLPPECYSLPCVFESMCSNSPNPTGVIGQGEAAIHWGNCVFQGSLSAIDLHSGYWIMVSEDDVLLLMGEPTPRDNYDLGEGANLVSYPYRYPSSIEEALPEDIGCDISGIIGEGVAALCNESGWAGSLSSLEGSYGYWFISEEAMDITFNGCDENCDGLTRSIKPSKLEGYEFVQSTQQAFYFLESVENIEIGDWILAYNGDEVIGARQWQGTIIDVPAMGDDGSDFTQGYIESGSVPQFKLLRDGELINLEGDIPAFENNQLFMVSSLTEAVPLPETFSLDRAYPNPFNPTTTLSFALPVDADVSLSIYNMQGREVSTLIDGNMDAGYHSVVWDANSYASGVYFVKMIAAEFVNTQKLMLIK
ncbi:T9SS C-terminal target domain-containing protein [Candidatus Marinimicrobia bacterium PRS2]|nr:T9SS C-terminal target domain-containing protein [Candidatus Marinimicrobia bacterium PRS2]